MEQQLNLYRVFIASPGDLGDERRALREVIEKINATFSKETELRIELLGWEDTLPGNGRPQELINSDLDKADLFVGCLWQRWGSVAGNQGKTGFEEEFDRAAERHSKRGSPEMWLFFKEVEESQRSDPGPQLQKVLSFRSRLTESRSLLYREFSDTVSWREMISELLYRRMLQRLVARTTTVSNEVQKAGTPQSRVLISESSQGPTEPQAKGAASFASLAEILKDAEHKVRAQKILVFDRSDSLSAPETVRLLLFAATNYDWNRQHVQLGVHEINSVFLHRRELEPTAFERLFLLRTVLLDEPLLTKPGWYWLVEWKLPLDTWLPWFASQDSGEDMRVRAIDFATRIGYPLNKRRKKFEPPVVGLLCDEHTSVRLAALRHLAALGRPSDLAVVKPLLQDDEKEVRAQAERAARFVRLRSDPDGETKRSIEQRDSIDEETALAVALQVERISTETLISALSHPSGELKAIAARELLKRQAITQDIGRVMCGIDEKAVRECGLLAQISIGEAVDTSKIRSSLRDPYHIYTGNEPWWNKANVEGVVSKYFDRLSAEELWNRVYSFDEDSHLAISAIGRRFLPESVKQIRADLQNDFEARLETLKKSQKAAVQHLAGLLPDIFGDPYTSNEFSRRRVRIAALEVLADHRDQTDRQLFLKFLPVNDSYDVFRQALACLRGISAVGSSEDRERVRGCLSSPLPSVQTAAARAYLALSPNGVAAAKDLLTEPTTYLVATVIRYALTRDERAVWQLLKPLLGHDSEDIRRLVCYFAVSVLKRTVIEKLLNEYLARGRYFYNVVTILDRALYAPKMMQTAFIKEEREFFEKWEPSATGEW